MQLKYKQELVALVKILVESKILRSYKINLDKKRIDALDNYNHPFTLSIKNDYLIQSCIEYLQDQFENVFLEHSLK